jgi:hypothetical protein
LRSFACAFAALLTLGTLAPVAAAAQQGVSIADNSEIAAMFAADQSDRSAAPIDWTVVGPRDQARLSRIAELLEGGRVQTAQDFHYAAVLYEHGHNPQDYLTAHLLAVVALAKGRLQAEQLAAASLDRYLLSIGQPQILGTQFEAGPGGIVQPNYDQSALPESLRTALGQSREALEQRRRFLSRFIQPAPAGEK